MAATKKLEKDHYLFREGDTSDAMFVVKTGKLAVVKSKMNSEIILAEIGPGSMVGEMAFFDSKPRSASVKALRESEVIILPFKGLHAQFAQFPEWAKAIMRTVNEHLRNANQRIKQLEVLSTDENDMFPPHTVNKLISILNLVGHKYGKMGEEGLDVPATRLRNYTIQIFQEPTHKMQKLMNALAQLQLMKVEDQGEGKQKIVIFKPEILYQFVEWYNDWLFKSEKDRITVKEEELKIVKALVQFGKKIPPNKKGEIKLALNDLQNDSMRELGYLVRSDDVNSLIEKKIIGDKMMEESGAYIHFQMEELEKTLPFWSIIYDLKRMTR